MAKPLKNLHIPQGYPCYSLAQPTISIVHTFSVRLENRVQNYSLAAVIYYSHEHFTTQIITRDGRVWFYDGMLITLTVPTLNCVGSINDPSFSLVLCTARLGLKAAALAWLEPAPAL